MTTVAEARKTVATPSKAIEEMRPAWQIVKDLMGGTSAMRGAGSTYLPKWPNEEDDAYQNRIRTATLFPAFSRTVTTLTGKPFSKPVTLKPNVPARIRKWMEDDADLQGRDLTAFASCVMETALGFGLTGILVDFPVVKPGTIRSAAEERAAGVRPYLIHVMPFNILGWRSMQINGVETLTQLRLREYVTVEDGDFGEKEVEQIRVLKRGSFEIWREKETTKGVKEWADTGEGGPMAINTIPFVPVYGDRTGFMRGRPPMIEMAYLNIKHWQSQSDQDTILHVARVPVLFIGGINDPAFKLTLGGSTAVKLPSGGTMGFVEHGGAAIDAGRTSLEDLKEEMRQAGAELLVLRPGQVTATEVASDNAVSMCALNRCVTALEDAFDLALSFTAQWVNEAEGGNVMVFNDFGAATLAEASMAVLQGLRSTGDLSRKTLLNETKRRGILSGEVDVDAELEAADADGPPAGTLIDDGGDDTLEGGGAGGNAQ